MRRKQSRRHKALPLLLAMFAVAIVAFAGLFFWSWYVPEIKRVPMQVTVTDTRTIGFNTANDQLYFGTLTPEGFAQRQTTITPAFDSIVRIRIDGEVAGWVSVSANAIALRAGEHKDIYFRLTVPAGTAPGNYTGEAVIRLTRQLPWQ
jgi:hypothetical protein